ncbi:hypothetical protein [Sebaldella sp. S0638]|uniref:hypothetical protein n=1 Tax=Sebaldella sp. S0638 TaxID=2957809 RepID=UPI0020A03031|nr:hypothetical protein [Sebaldella sp. S0638]MCP1223250.1 hypothetical protein [Sebaldella sp. S0638]
MAKKFSDEVCLENYSGICELFNKVIPDHRRFSVVYACGVDVGMTNFIVVRKTTYTYSSYAVGFDTNEAEIVILPIDIDMETYGTPVYLKKSEIDKAKISWLSKEITIRDKRLPKKYIQFNVPEMINQDPDNVVIPVKQDEEAKKFMEFFKKDYSK